MSTSKAFNRSLEFEESPDVGSASDSVGFEDRPTVWLRARERLAEVAFHSQSFYLRLQFNQTFVSKGILLNENLFQCRVRALVHNNQYLTLLNQVVGLLGAARQPPCTLYASTLYSEQGPSRFPWILVLVVI